MAAPKFTPGPWRAAIGHNGQHEVRGAGSATVALAYHTPDGLGAANADLIAAAPDLYAAAQRALNVLKAQGESVRPGSVLGALDAALAKARGES